MMWNRCVLEWLKNLRHDVEYYEEVAVYCGEMDAYENIWEFSTGETLDLKYGEVCRVSVAFSDRVESLKIAPVVYENVESEVNEDVLRWKKELRYLCDGEEENFFETEDLIGSFSEESKDVVQQGNKPANFPVCDEDKEEEVQTRPHRTGRTPPRPQTVSSMGTRKTDDSFYLTDVCKLEINGECCMKLKPNELVRLSNTVIQILDDQDRTRVNVNLKKGIVKQLQPNKIELIDTSKRTYTFVFSSTSDAKALLQLTKGLPSKSFSALAQLLKLLKKRSSRDLLESKGIIRNEPIFGNELEELCSENRPVPEVITRIVKLIEEPENITSMGVYRASGNLAVMQHIRCEINCGRWDVLEKYKNDVDVLTGTLKLFFRELKTPLIPEAFYHRLQPLTITGSPELVERTEEEVNEKIKKIVNSLPKANKNTLLYIIKHLLKVCSHKEENKMDIHNISICWGPSLIMFPANCHDLVTQTAEFTAITERLLDCYSKEFCQTEIVSVDYTYQIVQKFTEIIETNLNVEGIYRKSGSSVKIEKIMKAIDSKNLNEIDKWKNDIHELCCVLKKFLIKEPLMSADFFNRYCEIWDRLDEQSLREEVQGMVNTLPRKEALLLLLQHLRNVMQFEKTNKMSPTIMTDMWMTTLASSCVPQYKKKMPQFSKLFQILINLNEQVLPDLLPQSECLQRMRESKYDNVPDDNYDETDNLSNKDTKL